MKITKKLKTEILETYSAFCLNYLANPDVVFYTYGIQPRSYFLTCTLKL
jgi:hypothetical protein